jgi:hypothetical protein
MIRMLLVLPELPVRERVEELIQEIAKRQLLKSVA